MVNIISTINLKGGVGKTTITVALAEFLASEFDKKVLVIDLDPQTNATVALMAQDAWKERNQEGRTILQIFKDQIDHTDKFDWDSTIAQNISNIGTGIPNLDLMPSSLDFIDIQDQIPLIPADPVHGFDATKILRYASEGKLEGYDFVFLDCPPNLGFVTLNGICISNYYLVPCIPDILSTFGIPQIQERIKNYAHYNNLAIKPLGLIISMYRSQSNLHNTIINDLRIRANATINPYPRVFNTYVPLAVKTAEAAEFDAPDINTIRQKYGYGNQYDTFLALTQELMDNV